MKEAEFRGCDSFVCAKITKDDKTGYATAAVVMVAPIASVAKTTEVNSETHYYDNTGLIQIKAVGTDSVTFVVPAMYLTTLAMVTGGYIDPTTGAYMSGEDNEDEYAVGYRIKLTDGSYRYVWRLRGQFSGVPDENSNTESDSIDTNNQEVVYTGTKTVYEFPGVGRRRDIVIDERDGKCDLTDFFAKVRTPENIAELALASTTALSVSPTTASVAVGETTTITADVTPEGSTVVWSSSNSRVATVADGVVTGVAAGTAVITATSGNFSASAAITVTAE